MVQTHPLVGMTRICMAANHFIHLGLVDQQDHGKIADGVKRKSGSGMDAIPYMHV